MLGFMNSAPNCDTLFSNQGISAQNWGVEDTTPRGTRDPTVEDSGPPNLVKVWRFLDLQNAQNKGPYTGYTPCFGIFGNYVRHFGGAACLEPATSTIGCTDPLCLNFAVQPKARTPTAGLGRLREVPAEPRVSLDVYIYTHVNICLYVCMSVCKYMYVYIYIYTYLEALLNLHTLERGRRMLFAGVPSLFGLGLEDSHIATFWLYSGYR